MDVIALIIDNVEDKGTLYSLLTVSKAVFRHTCKVLYRDPMRFFRHRIYWSQHDTISGRISLLRLLVSLSPATDSDTNRVRDGFGLPRKHQSQPTAPATTMIDYLSFVRCLSWEGPEEVSMPSRDTMLTDWGPQLGRMQCEGSFLRSTITWSLCGHQLDQMRELEIEPDDIERYIHVAPQLSRLRTIVIAAFYRPLELPEHTYPSAVRLIDALHQHHGKDLVRECRFSPFIDSRVPRNIAEWNTGIRMRLPALLPRDLELALPMRPMDSHLSRLTVMTNTSYATPLHRQEEKIYQAYSDLSIGQFLQRCRSLVWLNLALNRREIDPAGVFAWAVHETQQRSAGRLLAPPVPLEDVSLLMDNLEPLEARRVLVDVVCGFSSSLRKLDVKIDSSDSEDDKSDISMPPLLDGETKMMQKLESLWFKSADPKIFDVRFLQFCPHLTSLGVQLNDSALSYGQTSTRWPVLNLPYLTQLTLSGRASTLFDPASIHGMPRLEKLALHDTKDTEFRPSYRPTLLDHWTWDWYLPELVTFQATMMSSEAKFSFRMLRCFPKLSELELEFATLEDEPPHQIEVLPALSNVAEDIFPALKILGMRGRFILQPEDLQILMRRALPSLWWFYIWVSDSCPAEQVLAHTRGHPSLTNVILCGELPDAARQKELGLKVYSDDIRIDPKVRPILYEFIKFQHGLKRFMLQERQQKWWKRLWVR